MTVAVAIQKAPITGATRCPPPRTRWFALLGASLLAVLGAAITGCEPSPAAERQVHMRAERMDYTVQTWAKAEQGRPARLQHSLDFIPFSLQRNATRFQTNGQWFLDWQKRDVQRFQDRGPIYLDKTGRLLWGKPQEIENNAILLFF